MMTAELTEILDQEEEGEEEGVGEEEEVEVEVGVEVEVDVAEPPDFMQLAQFCNESIDILTMRLREQLSESAFLRRMKCGPGDLFKSTLMDYEANPLFSDVTQLYMFKYMVSFFFPLKNKYIRDLCSCGRF